MNGDSVRVGFYLQLVQVVAELPKRYGFDVVHAVYTM